MALPLWSKVALSATLAIPLLGYLATNPAASQRPQHASANWLWPEHMAISTTPAADLAKLWPVADTDNKTNSSGERQDDRLANHAWALVAIIKQGKDRSALVLDNKRQVQVVRTGMQLDNNRVVTHIGQGELHWRNQQNQQGSLLLYPDSATADSATFQPES